MINARFLPCSSRCLSLTFVRLKFVILSVYVFRDSVFDSVWDEDSAFCFDVCVVSVMLGFVHVSGVPIFGFLE